MRQLTADFETTTDKNDCRVWAYAVCDIENPNYFKYGNNIDDFMKLCANKEENNLYYFHNLKFDGEFIFTWLFENGFKHVKERKNLVSKTFMTLISKEGQFYSIEVMFNKHGKCYNKVTFYNSLNILNFSVEEIGKGFGIEEQKLELDYKEYRKPGHELTPHEIEYIRCDVTIVAKALHILFEQGLTKMTQGSDALADYKRIITKKKFDYWFPKLTYKRDKMIRQGYKGGYTYCNPIWQGQDIGEGLVLDVNSLYPSRMYDCFLPFGHPIWFNGEYIEDEIYPIYVQQFTCNFDLKEGYLPTLQIKNTRHVKPEYAISSNGEDITLCLTSVDFALFQEHYEVTNIEYHGGYKFKASNKMFREYVDYWMEQKIKAEKEGNKALRKLAKLMLNALYGKFGLNPDVQPKHPVSRHDNSIGYALGDLEQRDGIYIPVAAFITAYARDYTIRSAQKLKHRFLYADTDSLHLIGTEKPEELEIDPYKLGAWKQESTFRRARYLHAKCYIEDIWNEKTGEYQLTPVIAGLPDKGKEEVTWKNFRPGAVYGGKLRPVHVPGGIVLEDCEFTIKS